MCPNLDVEKDECAKWSFLRGDPLRVFEDTVVVTRSTILDTLKGTF